MGAAYAFLFWAGLLVMLTIKWGKHMRDWRLWEWIGFASLWIGATILAIDGGLKLTSGELRSLLPKFFDGAAWALLPLVFVAIGTTTLFVHRTRVYSRGGAPHSTNNSEPTISSFFGSSVQILFTNKTSGVISVIWAKPDGNLVLYAQVLMGGHFQVTTNTGLAWLVRDAMQRDLLRYVATADSQQDVVVQSGS